MLLADKTAVIHGAGGAIGGAVARAYASEGARVFLAGRTLAGVETLAKEISAAGGAAQAAQVDALDAQEVDRHAEAVAAEAGGIDVSFNATSSGDNQGTPLIDMSPEEVAGPVFNRVRANHLTARAAARHMVRQSSGVILMITATPARRAMPLVGSFGVECAAIEGLCRGLAAELGPSGVRVVCLRSAGSPGTDLDEVLDTHGGRSALEGMTMLGRLPSLTDVVNVAVFLASDLAHGMTGTVANVTCGSSLD